jgi:glycosyltransferase involved in cell wall biosynthesis
LNSDAPFSAPDNCFDAIYSSHVPEHIPRETSRDGWFVAIAGRLAGVPLIIRTRHIDVTYPNPLISRHAFTTLADHVLCTSDQIRNHLQGVFGIANDSITTLPTGIDPSRFQAEGDGFPGLDGRRKKLVGMISVLRSWKGHGVFMDAARRLLDDGFKGDFVITGEGPMKGHIDEWIAESGHVGRFHLLGHTENVPEVLRSLDVLVIPSLRHEGIPQIGLQALASRTPIVGSDVGGIPEIVRNGETGRIVPPDDAIALATAINTTLADSKNTRSMTAAGRKLVEDRYSFSRMLDQLDQLYAHHLDD